jgi:hypothetical protein
VRNLSSLKFSKTLNISDSSEVLPTFSALRECLDEFVTMSSEKSKLEKVLNATCGSVFKDYMQGNPLSMIENVANACARFEKITSHVEEMVMLMETDH